MSAEENEKYLASMVHYLMETGRRDIAKQLLSSELKVTEFDNAPPDVVLLCSPALWKTYDEGPSEPDAVYYALWEALRAVFPKEQQIDFYVGVTYAQFDTDWRSRLLAEDETRDTHTNQNSYSKKPIIYNGMRFNSPPEVEIAKALERANVTYLPNCLIRTGVESGRRAFFPDFLIAHKGKWGILEVDGRTYHQGAAVDDYNRMRPLHLNVAFIDRREATACMNEPDKVVAEFLATLEAK